jgi:hypothetical protein
LNGGAGGSGIVIVRYVTTPSVSVTAPINNLSLTNGTTSISATATVYGVYPPFTVKFYTNSAGGGDYAEAGTSGSGPGPSFSVPLTGLADDSTNYIYAVVTDSMNETNTSSTNTFYLAAPVLPTVSVTAPTNTQTFAFRSTVMATGTVSGIGPFTVVFYTNNSGAYGPAGTVSVPVVGPFSRSLGTLDNGTYGIYAVVTDVLNQVASSVTTNTFTVNMPAVPSVVISSPTNNQSFAGGTFVTATGTVTGAGTPFTVTFYTNRNNSTFGLAGTSSGSGSSFTNALGALYWGTYGIYAVVTDVVNQAFTSTTNTFVVPPPSVSVTAPTNNQSFFSDISVSATASVANGKAPYTVTFWTNSGAGAYGSAGVTSASPYTVVIPASGVLAAPGSNTYHVFATVADSAGGSGTSTTNTFVFVNRPVSVTLTAPANSQSFAPGAAVAFTASITNGTAPFTVRYYTNSASGGYGKAGSDQTVPPYTVSLSSLAGGTYHVYATVTDSVGTATSTTNTFFVLPYAGRLLATGGETSFTTDGTNVYGVHTFTNTASATSIVFKGGCNVDVLVVAGGGGGGSYCAGGGGGGDVNYVTSRSVTGGTYTVTVGDGGAGGSGIGVTGSNSVFDVGGTPITAYGGGGGGGAYAGAPTSGGSGGGGDCLHNGAVAGSGANVSAGGNGNGTDTGGGGGGAGGKGNNATTLAAGDGGIGFQSSISGINKYYGGGGGGGSTTGKGAGKGGSAVGGAGGVDNTLQGYPGLNNTGGGGGGSAGAGGSGKNGGKGGSGIVIVRYMVPRPKGTLFMMR